MEIEIGQHINMSAVRCELEQQFECRGLDGQLEQQPDEFEQQCGFSPRLRFPSKRDMRIVEPQGCVVPHNGEIFFDSLFGRCFSPKISGAFCTMKRTGKLFDQVFSIDNMYEAYIDARRGKRKKRACFEFERCLGARIEALHSEIMRGTYRPEPYFQFEVHEPKRRTIHAPTFADVVVQHAIYRVIYPLFDRTFVPTSFACRKGYGTHMSSDYTQQAMRQCSGDDYFLQLDIRKFFYSIDRDILRRQIERKVKDRKLVDIMMLFAEHSEPRGIPIGNLLSQIYALIYLNPLDHFIKRELKIKHYARYVDDFVLIGLSREQCLDFRLQIIEFLGRELHLELSKTTIQKVRRGINFVGYRTWRSCRVIRKYSLYKFRRKVMRGDLAAVVSLLGHAKRTQSLQYMLKIIKESNHAIFAKLPKSYRQIYDIRAAQPGLGTR